MERPVDNAPYLRATHAGLTIEGWSRAAVQSYWRIPELKIGFDLGAQPWDFMGTPNWFVSHAHLDHIAAIAVYVARRRMMKMEPPTIYLPIESVEDVRKLLLIYQRMDRGRQLANIVGVEPGQEAELSREHIATFFNTTHTIPSRGIIVWERRKKLREEYVGLPGNEIRDLRLSGVEVSRETRIPLVCYTGDTSPEGLDQNPDCYKAKVLITEMSFVRARHRRDKIHKYGHMHVDDFLERMHLFQNEIIVVGHFSTRYHPDEVIRVLERKIPPEFLTRLKLWI
ncbi:MAG: MBL fold metallo-hydrolase [Gemmataceae bacterium]